VAIEVRPFVAEFVDRAAQLLAENCAPRMTSPEWPVVDVADREVARDAIAGSLGSGPAFAAVRDGELVGFLMSTLAGSAGRRYAEMRQTQHAAVRSARREVYRALYTTLSGQLVANGCFTHSVALPVAHNDALSTWFELGFGIDQIKGVRLVVPPNVPVDAAVGVREAESRDMDTLVEFMIELQKFHAGAPVFRPALIDLQASRQSLEWAMADERSGVWVAETDDHVVGMMEAEPDGHYSNTLTIYIAIATEAARSRGVGTQILAHVLTWAGEQRYEHCAVGWTSANQISDAFWRGRGFEPIRYRLTREFDDRVAWANQRLSYDFPNRW
jgi:GNAT superfamily N-acetyltransferase